MSDLHDLTKAQLIERVAELAGSPLGRDIGYVVRDERGSGLDRRRGTQPQKVAAMEGNWETGPNVPLLLFALPDEEARENRFELGIPRRHVP